MCVKSLCEAKKVQHSVPKIKNNKKHYHKQSAGFSAAIHCDLFAGAYVIKVKQNEAPATMSTQTTDLSSRIQAIQDGIGNIGTAGFPSFDSPPSGSGRRPMNCKN